MTKTQDLEKVRDITIRNILRDHLRSQKIDPEKPSKLPGEVFKGNNIPRMPIVIKKTQDVLKVKDEKERAVLKKYLLHQGIDPEKPSKLPKDIFQRKDAPKIPLGIPIRHVRMIEQSDTIRPISKKRNYQCIKPGSNHHMIIYELLDINGNSIIENGEVKRDGDIVPMIIVAENLNSQREEKRKKILINRELGKGKKFLHSLAINEMYMLRMPDGSHVLHRIQKLSEGSIILRPHTYAGKVSDSDKPPLIQRKNPNTLRGYKVAVDRLGRIRRAND